MENNAQYPEVCPDLVRELIEMVDLLAFLGVAITIFMHPNQKDCDKIAAAFPSLWGAQGLAYEKKFNFLRIFDHKFVHRQSL